MNKFYTKQRSDFLFSFAITFFILCLILGLSLFGLGRRKAPSVKSAAIAATPLPNSRDNFNMLIILGESPRHSPDCFGLMGFTPTKGYISVGFLPPETVFEGKTLKEIYRDGGERAVIKTLSSALSTEIEFYAVSTREKLKKLFYNIESFTYYLDTDLDYPLHQRQIALPKGEVKISGSTLCDIMFYPAYKGGMRERSDRCAIIISRLLEENLKSLGNRDNRTVIDAFFSAFTTNYSMLLHEKHCDNIKFLTRLNMPGAVCSFIDGTENKETGTFTLSQQCLLRLKDSFAL